MRREGRPAVRVLTAMVITLWISALGAGCQITKPEAASRDPFIVTAAGDYGSSDDTTATLDLMARSGASFNLALGDLSYSETLSESTWCDYVRSRVGPGFPFQLVSGNHEDDYGRDGHITNYATCLPDKMGVTSDYAKEYYFDYQGLARFILVAPDLTISGQYYYYGDANDHYQWVADAIDGARAARIPWVIVGMHKNCLSMGFYYCSTGADLMDLLIDKKVDVVLQAHDHTYQRSKQLSSGPSCTAVPVGSFNSGCVVSDGASGVYTKGLGTVFVVVGTAGADLYNIDTGDAEAGYFARWMGANSHPRKGFMKFDVSTAELSAEFVGPTVTSDFTDHFVIRKAS